MSNNKTFQEHYIELCKSSGSPLTDMQIMALDETVQTYFGISIQHPSSEELLIKEISLGELINCANELGYSRRYAKRLYTRLERFERKESETEHAPSDDMDALNLYNLMLESYNKVGKVRPIGTKHNADILELKEKIPEGLSETSFEILKLYLTKQGII